MNPNVNGWVPRQLIPKSAFDEGSLLASYRDAVATEKCFRKKREEIERSKELLAEQASQLGLVVRCLDSVAPVPSQKVMEEFIDKMRSAYLIALFIKNFHLFVKAADNGDAGMVHIRKDERRNGSNGMTRWTYGVRSDYIKIPCDEKITKRCLPIYKGMSVLAWDADGYDRDGMYSKTGHPSAWSYRDWRLPRSVTPMARLLWQDAEVKVSPYVDFRKLLFNASGGGSDDGSSRFESRTYPQVWDSFGLNGNEMQFKFPMKSIGWSGKDHVSEIVLRLLEDETGVGDIKHERKA